MSEKRPLLLSCHGSPEYEAMINDHRVRHQAYADRHGYEYKIVALDHDAEYDPWSRLKLIHEHLNAGEFVGEGQLRYFEPTYSHVFWLDADCVIIDPKADMRKTLPQNASYGFTIHPYPIATYRANKWHWQTGQMYFRCDHAARWFIGRCLHVREVYANDQHAINSVLMSEPGFQSGLVTLYQSWNNTLHDEMNDGTIVAAFHGFGRDLNERRQAMLNVAAQFPYTLEGYAEMGRNQLGVSE